MSRSVPFLAVLAGLSLALAAPAHAVLITVNFTLAVDASSTDLPNAGTSTNGSFTFDSSLIPAGGGSLSPGPYESSINFTFDGTAWTSANADVYNLQFDSSGNLTAWRLGGAPGGATNISAFNNADDILFTGGTTMSYAKQGNTTRIFAGNLTWSVDSGTQTAPEPASWLLLVGGILGVAGVRRRPDR
jgi:hypothetical protein